MLRWPTWSRWSRPGSHRVRWVQRFTPLLTGAARSAATGPGDRWFVDETYVKVNRGLALCLPCHRPVQAVIGVVSVRRDADAARRFFRRALGMLKVAPSEVVTDAAAVYPAVLAELIPSAWHHVERHADNPIEADHSRLKPSWLRPMRGLQADRTAH